MNTAEPPEPRLADQRKAPPVTEALRQQARRSPNSWIYSIDSAYDSDGAVPPQAVIGAWPVDEDGRLGSFIFNDRYRPSPVALQLPSPSDAVDAALQLAATGHGSESDVLTALAAATVYLPADRAGELLAYRDVTGEEFVAIFTDAIKAPRSAEWLQPIDVHGLLKVLPDDTTITLNPGSELTATIFSDRLRQALRARSHDEVPPSGPAQL